MGTKYNRRTSRASGRARGPLGRSVVLAGLMLGLVCSAGCAKKGAKAGSERGDCYGNGSCDEGLLCLSNLCVRPPPADCQKVSEKLGFLTLGNYTPRKTRDDFHKQVFSACKTANLTEAEGDCILGASNKRALSKCNKPLVFANCKRMLEHALSVLGADDPAMAKTMRKGEERVLAKCREEHYTKLDEACVLAAKTAADFKACRM